MNCTKAVIGTARLERGLYVIDIEDITGSVSNTVSSTCSNSSPTVSSTCLIMALSLPWVISFFQKELYIKSLVLKLLNKMGIQHVVHLINRLPSPLLNLKCPYEMLHKQPPTIVHLKVFGCLSYVTTLQAHRTKFDSRARKAIFLGFKDGTKGYVLYDLNDPISPIPISNTLPIPVMSESDPSSPITDTVISPLFSPNTSSPTSSNTTPSPASLPNPLRRSSRTVKPPSYLENFHCNSVLSSTLHNTPNPTYPLSSVLSYDKCAPVYKSFCCSISAIVEPQTFNQA
ncbi:hypothetical protein A2U01_0004735, partial [Trifolium medium]|nr:hypothetical protein [Trifolium medium]